MSRHKHREHSHREKSVDSYDSSDEYESSPSRKSKKEKNKSIRKNTKMYERSPKRSSRHDSDDSEHGTDKKNDKKMKSTHRKHRDRSPEYDDEYRSGKHRSSYKENTYSNEPYDREPSRRSSQLHNDHKHRDVKLKSINDDYESRHRRDSSNSDEDFESSKNARRDKRGNKSSYKPSKLMEHSDSDQDKLKSINDDYESRHRRNSINSDEDFQSKKHSRRNRRGNKSNNKTSKLIEYSDSDEHSSENERTQQKPFKDTTKRHRNGVRENELDDERDKRKRSHRDEQRSDSSPEAALKMRKDVNEKHAPALNKPKDFVSEEPLSKRVKMDNINMRTGGAYIPPAKLRMMQEKIKDKGSEPYQRIAWEALKKSIVGMTNKVNTSNLTEIVRELFRENIIRGRGILVRAIMQAQAVSPTFTRVYAALVAIINTKFPQIGELILKRLIIQYRRGFRRNDKTICLTAARFIAHLFNQEVAHEILVLEMITHLLETPTEDSVEVAIACLKECGLKLTQLTSRGMRAITQRVRDILHDAMLDVRIRYMIEVFFAIQKDGFKDFETIPKELDLVEEEDKYTHMINLDEEINNEEILNIFKFDPNYEESEEQYKSILREILGDGEDESGESGSDDDDDEDEENEEKKEKEGEQIIDMTETNLVCLRRRIYLTIQSSLDFEECAHKLLKLELKPGQILEMCYMILDCCAQQRTYEKFYGLLGQRFCQISKTYVEPFTEIFQNSYQTIHRLETNKLRNVAKFFAHLLYTDAISWMVLSIIKLNEDDTSSSSRIFIKILFQELCEYMGLTKLNERVKDVTLQGAFDGLFPKDHPRNTRFAINFFTSIGLGGLTDELREHLKNPVQLAAPPQNTLPSPKSSSSSSSSSSTESEDDRAKRRKSKKNKKRKKKKKSRK